MRKHTLRTLVSTELKLSLRDMNMPIFAIAFPVIVIFIIGMLYGTKPAFEGASYSFLAQSFGAVSAIGISAAGLMGLPIVISDYRHKKILKRLSVTPVGPILLMAAQVIVNLMIVLTSVLLVFTIVRVGFKTQLQGSLLIFTLMFLLVSAAIFSMGLLIAAVSPNIQTSNLLCTLAYFPMLIFSGATLPYEVMPKAMQAVANLMPLTQGIKLLKHAALGLPLEGAQTPILVMLAITCLCMVLSVRYFKWE